MTSAVMHVGSMLRSIILPCHLGVARSGRTGRVPERRGAAAANAGWRKWAVAGTGTDEGEGDDFLTRSPRHCTSRAPSTGKTSILLCGEGDFSFARALASSMPDPHAQRITATSYEPVEEIMAAWGGADNLQELGKFQEFVEVVHGVDATNLDKMFPDRRWDKICFMFPHIAGKGRISLNRKLLAGFFGAATRALSPGGTVEVALVAGQGGTPADGEARRDFGNTWQAVTQAAEGDARLVLCDTAEFDSAAWETLGYRSRGHWRGLTQERGFTVRNGVVHLFRREGELGGATCPAPVSYLRDISFWIDDPFGFSEEKLLHVVRETAGDGVDTELLFLEEWRQDQKISRTYRVTYSSIVLAFSRERANASQFALRDAIEDGSLAGVSLR